MNTKETLVMETIIRIVLGYKGLDRVDDNAIFMICRIENQVRIVFFLAHGHHFVREILCQRGFPFFPENGNQCKK